ncbi:MAG: hypothetical protein J6T32_01005 [Paludibacteraceae bacterium]|nr:hypothetical protein [Paludibacteraceae bacterium]
MEGNGNHVCADNPVTFTAWGHTVGKAVFSDGVALCPNRNRQIAISSAQGQRNLCSRPA